MHTGVIVTGTHGRLSIGGGGRQVLVAVVGTPMHREAADADDKAWTLIAVALAAWIRATKPDPALDRVESEVARPTFRS